MIVVAPAPAVHVLPSVKYVTGAAFLDAVNCDIVLAADSSVEVGPVASCQHQLILEN